MRLHTMRKQGDWLADAEESFRNAIREERDLPDAHFYMGVAYKKALKFDKAGERLEFVLALNRERVTEADEDLRLLQKIERAMPGSEVGKNLALKSTITRAEASAVFVQELKLPRLLWDSKPQRPTMKTIPADIKDHPLRADMEALAGLGIRGLTPYPDGRFEPDAPLNKSVYAMMLEDIIVILARDNTLSAKYVGNVSPFSDVNSDAPYFNAVMLCTARGIIDPAELRTAKFFPQSAISGADALLSIRRLKGELKIF
jgi:tetratricopeptide (TPR) repeat protein